MQEGQTNNNKPPTSNINWKKQPGRGDGHQDPDLSGSDSSDNESNKQIGVIQGFMNKFYTY